MLRFARCRHLVTLLAMLLLSRSSFGQQVRVLIPPLHATTLSGAPVDLPAALHGKSGVLVVGFSQGSREQVSTWGKRLAADFFTTPDVTYYEIAMLEDVPRLLRGLVTRRIKEQVSARGQVHFVPVIDHEDDWKTAAAYGDSDVAYVLLVDGKGAVEWRTGGAFSEQKYADLVSRLHALQAKP